MISNATAQATAPAANDIRDIKPPIEIASGYVWVWWMILILTIVIAAFLFWRWLKNKKANIVLPPPLPAHVRAKQKLQEALALIANPKPFVIAVSDTARFYLEERFQFRAPERTTEEFLRELGGTKLLLPEQKESLGEFLAGCDLVKFAKYEPGENELRGLHSSAVRLVEETEPNEPQANEAELEVKKNTAPSKGKTLAVLGTALQLGNIVFFFAYAAGLLKMVKLAQNFSEQATHQTKIDLNNPFALVQEYFIQIENIGNGVLVASVIGVLIGFIGLILICIALVKQKYRAEWFFWFLAVYSFILMGVVPLGTIAGIVFLVYCLTKRREFLNRS